MFWQLLALRLLNLAPAEMCADALIEACEKSGVDAEELAERLLEEWV